MIHRSLMGRPFAQTDEVFAKGQPLSALIRIDAASVKAYHETAVHCRNRVSNM